MARNPILELAEETLKSGGDLASARQAIATRAREGHISPHHIKEALALVRGDEAKARMPEELRLVTAALLFEAAQSHPSLDDRLRFATSLTLLQVIPGGQRYRLALRVEAAQAALSRAPQDLPDALKAGLLGDLGSSLAQVGRQRDALPRLEEALGIYRRLAQAEPAAFEPDVAMTLNNLGTVLSDLGERPGARAAYEEALGIYRRLAEAEPAAFEPDVAMTLNNLGNVLSNLGERAGAREAYEEALAIRRGLAEAEPAAFQPDVAMTLNNLGNVLRDLGERAGARAAYEESLGIYRRLAQPEPAAFEPHVAGTLNNLGSVLSALGERAGARAAYEQALQRAVAGDPSLRPRIMANLAVRLYDDGERKKGLDLAWQAVEIVETMLADARHAEVRHSFKGEIENAYRLVLCDPQLEKDSLRAHRLVEALREGEALAGFGGWHGALLEIQRAHDGALFLANLASGTVFERGDASWTNAGGELLQEVLGAEEARQDRTGRIAAAGQKLWNSLPGAVQDLLLSPPRGGIALSLDPQTGVLPLEFLTPTGKPEDFLCLKMEMPRAPGERLFRQCQERNLIGDGVGPRSLVFGNPTHPPLKDYPLLQYAEQEAVDLASRLEALGFSPALDGKAAWIAGDAHVERFLEGLAADPAIIHFAGHGGILSDEECLIFAGMDMLFSDGLLKQARRPLGCQPFVFLNSCWTGRPRARGGAFRGLPIAFLQLGAAAVVASVFPVADQRAALFAGTFYERLFAGDTVGEAMLHTRQEMYGQEINCLHWGRPVFYGNPHARLVLPKRV